MKKLLVLLIIFANIYYSHSQSESELYSNIITKNIKRENKIIVVKKIIKDIGYQNKIFDIETDKYTEDDFFILYEYTKDNTELFNRFKSDKKIKKVVTNLYNNINLKKKNRIPKNLDAGNVQIKYISKWKYNSFFKTLFGKRKDIIKGWKNIEKKYKTRIVFEFSKISYLGNYASFYYSMHCGGLCGSGNIVIFERFNGKWKLLKEFNIWMS